MSSRVCLKTAEAQAGVEPVGARRTLAECFASGVRTTARWLQGGVPSRALLQAYLLPERHRWSLYYTLPGRRRLPYRKGVDDSFRLISVAVGAAGAIMPFALERCVSGCQRVSVDRTSVEGSWKA